MSAKLAKLTGTTAAAVVLSLALAACDRSGAAGAAGDPGLHGRLLLTGSSTIAPLAAEIGKRFEALHPGVRVDVQTGGSSRGIADAAAGLADLGMSSRALSADEQRQLESWVVARDGVGLVVHATNPVTAVTSADLRAILAGAVDDWAELGGTAGPITVINRAAGRSEVELLSEHLGLRSSAMTADLIAGENQQALKMVAATPGGFTYLSVGAAAYAVAAGEPVRLLALDNIPASVATVADGSYPVSRPLVFVTRPGLPTLGRALLAYATSSAVHDLVREYSYVPPGP